jgi:hypothetical protein
VIRPICVGAGEVPATSPSCGSIRRTPARHCIDPDSQRGRAKYESHGGPALAGITELLNAYAPDPTSQLRALLQRLTFTVIIGDADAHGKNISLLHPGEGHVTLAPLYDTVPTQLWPTLRPTAVLHVNGRDQLATITAEDLIDEAHRWGLSPRAGAQTVAAELPGAPRSRPACAGHGEHQPPAQLLTPDRRVPRPAAITLKSKRGPSAVATPFDGLRLSY